jgi:hypothetical protein
MNHTSYPKIEQFRNALHTLKLRSQYAGEDSEGRPIYDESRPLPTVKFRGTIKLHGTNAAICEKGGEIWFQSRTNIISPLKDNAGFATKFSNDKALTLLLEFFADIRAHSDVEPESTLALYGEWCGKGIQKGVAINQLDKRFVIFGFKEKFADETKPSRWMEIDSLWRDGEYPIPIFNILDYPTYEVEVDLNNPQIAQATLVKLTDEVEAECPFAAKHGVSGIGEGIVWTGYYNGDLIRFKTKGEKHSVSKAKEKIPIAPEKLASIEEFVTYAVTESRLEQAYQTLGDTPTVKQTGAFIGWISKDISQEEVDVLSESDLTMKEVGGAISGVARKWFFEKLNTNAGL